MIKHTQAICQQQQTTYLSVFGQFELLALKGLQEIFTPLPSCTNIYFFFCFTLFYKQPRLGSNTQGYLHFIYFQGSRLLEGCLLVWPNKQTLSVLQLFFSIRTITQRSKKFL